MQAVGLLMYSVPSNFRFGVTHSRRTKCINDNLSENLRRHANFFFHLRYTYIYLHTYIVAGLPYNIQNLIWMQYRKATIDVYSGRCGAVHHFSLKDAHSKVASPECCTLESKYFWSCISILMPDLWFFLVSLLTIFEEISSKNCGGRHEHNYNKGFDPIVCTRN